MDPGGHHKCRAEFLERTQTEREERVRDRYRRREDRGARKAWKQLTYPLPCVSYQNPGAAQAHPAAPKQAIRFSSSTLTMFNFLARIPSGLVCIMQFPVYPALHSCKPFRYCHDRLRGCFYIVRAVLFASCDRAGDFHLLRACIVLRRTVCAKTLCRRCVAFMNREK